MNKSEMQGFDISSKRAAVIGCGGLGCNIAVHLAGAGIGELIICDFDTVGESNLNRQFLYTPSDIGKKKVFAAEKRLGEYSPRTKISAYDIKIRNVNELEFLKQNDIIFLAVDNNEARRVMQEFCAENKIPLVNGGINGFFGTAYVYVPDKTACLDCAGLTEKESGKVFSVSSTAGITGALQSELGIKLLTGQDEAVAGILHIYDSAQIHKLKIKPQENCGICGVNKNV